MIYVDEIIVIKKKRVFELNVNWYTSITCYSMVSEVSPNIYVVGGRNVLRGVFFIPRIPNWEKDMCDFNPCFTENHSKNWFLFLPFRAFKTFYFSTLSLSFLKRKFPL